MVERALAERLADPELIEAQARRPLVAQRPLQDADRIAVLAHALSLRSPAFAGDPLAALGAPRPCATALPDSARCARCCAKRCCTPPATTPGR
ncbi:hypothetical protein FE772_09350 [Lysobacter enzymogenes]|nr:hypothetical protein [Lysobacter enzymogenes]QCW25836.1 hypothetical protein FE772_09350 [Lysobacter enzymogenes]